MRGNTLIPVLILTLVGSASVLADDDLDVTMRMVTDDEPLGDSIVRQIELPESASDRAHEMAAPGLERAEEASERGREAAEAARERGRATRGRPNELPEPGKPLRGGPKPSGQDARGNQPDVPSPN